MIKKLAGTFIAAGALLAFTAPAAHAAPPEPFTITEALDFQAGVFTFTATGPSVSFWHIRGRGPAVRWQQMSPDPSKVNFLIRTVYTCDDGDTFFAQKHVFAAFNENGTRRALDRSPSRAVLVITPGSAVMA